MAEDRVDVGLHLKTSQFDKAFSNSMQKAEKQSKELGDRLGDLGDILPGKFGNISQNVAGVGQSITGLASKMGPIGIAAAGITAAFAGWGSAILSNDKTIRQYRKNLGNVSTDFIAEMKGVATANAVTEEDLIKTTKNVAKEFGISYEEAGNLIDKGFQRGANSSGEFLEMLKEYPTQFKKVGLSAEESIALFTQIGNEGFFSDRGADAIKEAGLRIEAMSKSSADALKGIGIDPIKLKNDIDKGLIKPFDAIKNITKRMATLGETSSKTSAAITSLFGTAGEDVGFRFFKTLADSNLELDKMAVTMSGLEIANSKFNTAWEKFKLSLGDSNSLFGSLLINIENFGTSVLNKLTEISTSTWKENLRSFVETITFKSTAVKKVLDELLPQEFTNEKTRAFKFTMTPDNIKKLDEKVKPEPIKNLIKDLNKNTLRSLSKEKPFDITPQTQGLARETVIAGGGVREININIDKQIETVNIHTNENPEIIKNTLQRLMTEIFTDANSIALA